MNLARLLCAAALSVHPLLAGEVHTVALGGAGDFATLQGAVDFASDGDTIVVEGGNYSSWTGGSNALVSGKGLDIVSGTGEPRLLGTVEIRDLAPGQDVRLEGLFVTTVRVVDCAAEVLLEGLNESQSWFEQCDLLVQGTQTLCVSRSRFEGFNGWDVCGGQCNYGADGGDAVTVVDSKVRLYDCFVRGGIGEDGAWVPCGVGGDGGDGLVVVGASSSVRHEGSNFLGGLDGLGGCGNGWVGSPINAPAGTVTALTTPTTNFTGPPLAAGGTTVDLTITGPPGTPLLLLTTTDFANRDLLPSVGTLHMLWPFVIEALPPIPAQGVVTHSLAVPALPAGQARLRIMQVVFNQPGARFLSQPLGLTVRN